MESSLSLPIQARGLELTSKSGKNSWKLCSLAMLKLKEEQAEPMVCRPKPVTLFGHRTWMWVKTAHQAGASPVLQLLLQLCLKKNLIHSSTYHWIYPSASQLENLARARGRWEVYSTVGQKEWHLNGQHSLWFSSYAEQNWRPHMTRELGIYTWLIWFLRQLVQALGSVMLPCQGKDANLQPIYNWIELSSKADQRIQGTMKPSVYHHLSREKPGVLSNSS